MPAQAGDCKQVHGSIGRIVQGCNADERFVHVPARARGGWLLAVFGRGERSAKAPPEAVVTGESICRSSFRLLVQPFESFSSVVDVDVPDAPELWFGTWLRF